MNKEIEASDRSVAADKIDTSIITTGDNSPVFLGGHERLRDAVIQPDEVFRRVHIESFVGRRWLIDQVDSILDDENNSCGYLVLEAHAGLGKTAFLAWLVKERDYIHHFVELAPGQEGIEKGRKNLVAQIIIAYKLSAEEAIPDAAGRSDYLYHLLSQAAEKRGSGERIVVVVDALDEAGTPPNQNVLGLPKVLPEGVFFIVSMRPVQVTLQSDRSITPRWFLEILAESPENLADLKSLLQASAAWPKVKQALDESRYTADQFIDSLIKKSGGLWIYLHFVIPEIERGERSPLDLDKLPEGLQEYYAGYWARWREDNKWYKLYLPFLTTLAAAQEPCTLERILNWAGIVAQDDEKLKLRRILKEKWRPFLAISGEGKEEKYRFYHATVREFFEGKVKQNSPMASENGLIDELSLATRERHRVIAESYFARWGGLEKGLPDLMNKIKGDDGYGLRHLAAHLEASEQDDKLHRLLSLETQRGRNLWYEVKKAGGDTTSYINDLMRAWRLAERDMIPGDVEKTGKLIGLQNRYALIFASINSISANIPAELLLALVENGIWSEEEGLAHARHVPDLPKRSRVLTELSLLLKEPKFLDEALATAREIPDERLRAQALVEIAPKLQDAREALAVARGVWDKKLRAQALAEIAPKFKDDQRRELLDEALATAREIQDRGHQAWVLAKIASNLQDAQKTEVLNEVRAIAREIQDKGHQAWVLARIAPNLKEAQKTEVLNEALALVKEIQDTNIRIKALAEIVANFQDGQKRVVLNELLAAIREIQHDRMRNDLLVKIAAKLQDAHEALALIRGIQSNWLRAQALAEIAPKHKDDREALATARGIWDEWLRAKTLARIALRLRDAQKTEVLNEALATAREIRDKRSLDQALAEIAPNIQDAKEALALIREIPDEGLRAPALAEIASRLQDAKEALALIREIRDEWLRAPALVEIAPRLLDAKEALVTAREIPDERLRIQALAEIAPRLLDAQKREILNEVLEAIRKIPDEWLRYRALAEIAPRLQDAKEALALIREIPDEGLRAQALAKIASRLQDTKEALALIREIPDEGLRARALVEIAPILQDAQKTECLDEALALIREIPDERLRVRTLTRIAPNLQDAKEALALIREIPDERLRAQALVEIAPNLQDAKEALALIREIPDERLRAQALVEIAPKIKYDRRREVLDEALASAREIQDNRCREKALEEIVLSLLAHESLTYSSIWPPTIHSLSIRRRMYLLSDLSSLAPLAAKLGGDDALLETIQAIKDVGRWWP